MISVDDLYFISSVFLYSTGHWIGGSIVLLVLVVAMIARNR